ncbi:MFS family permease [Sporomusaceae bacterium BoRhaA]|uniref:multidrug efflux MFS transporter n=1 Tax=Pelorhabdus rhamnosifermentans TaxID=2772457 RepID=UPI001C05F190|nr:multidrug efflux MFS transporter [Pelorhabdus rhamnosifermentans]MBU2702887.1 MFS family permease [Pelorhabdus rhamnosifermentans]
MEFWKRNLLVCWLGCFATAAGLSQIAPVLPLYIEHLGVQNIEEIEQLSGFAFGVTFIIMAIASPIWGQAADRYGRKPMLLRASLGMAIVITCMGFVQNVYQLVGLRLVQGAVSGFVSAAITLIATQAPKERAGWALGTLSTGAVGGMLLGPLIGGYLAETWGLRSVFFGTGTLLLIAFMASLLFVQEDFKPPTKSVLSFREVWNLIPNPGIMITMFVTTFILQLALLSIEPIITVYITQLHVTNHVALISGLVFAASGFANMLAAPQLGKISDKIGPQKVMLAALIAAGMLFIPQAFVTTPWQLMALRFLLGIAAAGLLPSINTLIMRNTPTAITGRCFGYNQSAQFLGSFGGSLLGGQTAATFGIHYVFFVTGALLLLNALWVYTTVCRQVSRQH